MGGGEWVDGEEGRRVGEWGGGEERGWMGEEGRREGG